MVQIPNCDFDYEVIQQDLLNPIRLLHKLIRKKFLKMLSSMIECSFHIPL